MILQKEIVTIAEQKGVLKSTIDKDWVLGHFLAAIYSEQKLRELLIFKGGTCLKKCWFPDYRFSEDLDFTCRTTDFELTQSHLDFICLHVKENANILSHVASLKPLKFKDKLTGYEAIIKFWGSDHPKNETPPPPERWQTKIKIEITLYEKLIFPQTDKKLFHGALFFHKQDGIIVKISRGSKTEELLELIRLQIHLGNVPIFVSEGKAKLKEDTIAKSIYLSFCRAAFKASHNRLVIYGFSFSDYDEHLINDLNENKRKLAIGVHLSNLNEDQIQRKLKGIEKQLYNYKASEIKYFDSRTLF